MIPAVLAAQFAKPLVKWGAIGGGIAILLLSVWLHGRSSGKAVVQQAWDAAIAEQAAKSAARILKDAQVTSEVLQAHAEAERKTDAAIQVLEREVIRYVHAPAKSCSVDPEFVRLFDELSRLPALHPDRVPATDVGAGASAETSATDLTTTEVLQAYQHAAEELTSLWTDYHALVQWERKQAQPD